MTKVQFHLLTSHARTINTKNERDTYGLSGCDRRCFCSLVEISSARVTLSVRRLNVQPSSVSEVIFCKQQRQNAMKLMR